MQDFIVAQTISLSILSGCFMAFFFQYQYYRKEEPQNTPLSIFGWSMFCISVGLFFACVLTVLWDVGALARPDQFKLSVIPRMFWLAGVCLALYALDVRWKWQIMVFSVIASIVIFTFRVIS